MMIAGLFLTFFTSHRRIWVRVLETERETKVDVAGTTNKNPVGLQRDLEHLTRDLRELLGKKG